MKNKKRMTVREMDRVNRLIDLTTKIDRLALTERERALIYFKYKELEVESNLTQYAAKFDELVRETQSPKLLDQIKGYALEIRQSER